MWKEEQHERCFDEAVSQGWKGRGCPLAGRSYCQQWAKPMPAAYIVCQAQDDKNLRVPKPSGQFPAAAGPSVPTLPAAALQQPPEAPEGKGAFITPYSSY